MAARQLKIYGASAALTVEAQRSKSDTYATVGIEAARKNGDSQTYNWSTKTVVQVTEKELPVVLAVLLNFQSNVEFKYHGPNRNKSYEISGKGKGVLISLSSAENGNITVPVSGPDIFCLSSLVMLQLQRNHGGLPGDVIIKLLDRSFRQR